MAVLSHKWNNPSASPSWSIFWIKAITPQQWAATERNDKWNFVSGFSWSLGAHVGMWPDWPSRKLPCTWRGLCLTSQPRSHPVNAVVNLSVLVSWVIEEFLPFQPCFAHSAVWVWEVRCVLLWLHLAEEPWLSVAFGRLEVLCGVYLCKSNCLLPLGVVTLFPASSVYPSFPLMYPYNLLLLLAITKFSFVHLLVLKMNIGSSISKQGWSGLETALKVLG